MWILYEEESAYNYKTAHLQITAQNALHLGVEYNILSSTERMSVIYLALVIIPTLQMPGDIGKGHWIPIYIKRPNLCIGVLC